MKKLPQVFLVLTALGLGVMYGYYDFRVEGGYRGSFLAHVGETIGRFRRKAGKSLSPRHKAVRPKSRIAEADRPKIKHPEKEQAPVEGEYAERVIRPEREKTDMPQVAAPPYKAELDRADEVILAASTYYQLAVMKEEKRQEYARKILDSTEDTLEMLDDLNQKFPGRPEIEERLQEIFRLRQFAAKELGAG